MILWGIVVSVTTFISEASDFMLVNQWGTVIEGEDLGLLLYKGGTVCDDRFTDTAADAICKDMNYAYASRWTRDEYGWYFKEGFSIRLDDVHCDTPEWERCTYTENHNCAHSEDVFLSCSREGAADAICKDMSYTRAISWTSSLDFGLVQKRRNIMLDDVSCNTTEWESCFYEEDHNCDHSEDVFLSCSRETKEELFALVDRYGDKIAGEDLGLLLYKGGTVCDDGFTDTAADAICKQMNYTRAISWTVDDYWLIQRSYVIMIDDVNCETSEWDSCTYTYVHNCDHSEDVFLSCSGEGDFMLVNQWGTVFEGEDLGLLLYKGGTVCDDGFTDTAADAICKHMNYTRANKWITTDTKFDAIKYNYDIKLDDVSCSNTEWENCIFSVNPDCSHSEDVLLSCLGKDGTDRDWFTDFQSDTGWFPDSAIIKQTRYVSESACVELCRQFQNCRAAVLSPSSWAYRECFIVTTQDVTWRGDWSTAFRHITEQVFSIADENGKTGASSGTLLYKGGTVCPESFYYDEAIAVCSFMGYENENEVTYWRSTGMYGVYEKTLFDVSCDWNREWSSCTHSDRGTCYTIDDVYLQCKQEKKGLSAGYIVLIVAAVLVVVVSAIYYLRRRRQNLTSQQQQNQSGETIANAAIVYNNQPPIPNPIAVELPPPSENIYETSFQEPAPALGTDDIPPPQYYNDPTVQFGDDQIPSYEEVMANDHIYQKPV